MTESAPIAARRASRPTLTRSLRAAVAVATATVAAVAGSAGAGTLPTARAAAPAPATTWSVGPGWSVVVLARGADKPGRVFLVSPGGRRTAVTTLAAGERVEDASPNGRHAVVLRAGSATGYEPGGDHDLLDLRTGRRTRIAGHWSTPQFSPDGRSLLAREMLHGETHHGTYGQWLRIDLSGRTQAVIWGTTVAGMAKQDPTGRLVAVHGRSAIQVNDAATGRLVRSMRRPAGVGPCEVRHWEGTSFTVSCFTVRDGRFLETVAFRYRSSGGAPVALVPGLRFPVDRHPGVEDVWRTPAGTFSQVSITHVGLQLARTSPGAPALLGHANWGSVVVGSRAWLLQDAMMPAQRLVVRDLRTGRQTVLAGGSRDPGFVITSASVITTNA